MSVKQRNDALCIILSGVLRSQMSEGCEKADIKADDFWEGCQLRSFQLAQVKPKESSAVLATLDRQVLLPLLCLCDKSDIAISS
ncbi:unnamed protein product [Larinioides sclopetarius]|uniref:Uncharacterized protein n=1 Tax=Larinioides sclopetarius TaxID=280406 RepID=A0AAV1Z3E6_9ARAC